MVRLKKLDSKDKVPLNEACVNDMVHLKELGTNGCRQYTLGNNVNLSTDMFLLKRPGTHGMVHLTEPVSNDMVHLNESGTNGSRQYTLDNNVNLSTDMAVLASREFLARSI